MLPWVSIVQILAIQLEPFELCLLFVDDTGKEHAVTEFMDGWIELLEHLRSRFDRFDWERFAEAKLHVNKPYSCWARM